VADKGHRAIAGLSMGGGGTTGYAIRHADMFSSACAMSALMGMVENTWINRDPDKRRSVFMQSVVEYNNITAVKNADKELVRSIASVRWFIDVGDDDFLFDNNMEFISAMREKRIPYQLRVRDGGHTWPYWQEALRMALPFVSEGFAGK
jgi:S-formylglutathione hydrolase FrmB